MKIKYWTSFSKRKNSTLTPTGGTEVNAVLKGPTSELNPVFELQGVTSAKYVYCATFGRYYYVTDVVHLTDDIIQISCAVDVMSSHKGSIGSTSAYIEYTSASSRKNVYDSRNVPTGYISSTHTALTYTTDNFDSQGCYIVSVLGDGCNGINGVCSYYAMDSVWLAALADKIYSQNFIADVVNQFNAVQDSLVSCVWIPVKLNSISGTNTTVKIGRIDSECSGRLIGNRIINSTTGITTISYDGRSGGAGSEMTYFEMSPLATACVYLPFVGFVELNADLLGYTKNITVDYWADVITGDIVYNVYFGAVRNASFSGNMATKMPVSSAAYDGMGVVGGVMTTVGGVVGTAIAAASSAGTAAVLGGVAGIVGGAATAAKSLEFHTHINGSNSSAVAVNLGKKPYVVVYQKRTTYQDIDQIKTTQGLPYFETALISSVSGYVKCNGASVSISGYESEREEINGYLNSGFYYE